MKYTEEVYLSVLYVIIMDICSLVDVIVLKDLSEETVLLQVSKDMITTQPLFVMI